MASEPRKIVLPGKSPMANTDYTQMLGANIDQGKNDPFGGEVPKDARGYAAYRSYYEQRAMDIMQGQGMFKMTTTCEGRDAKGNRIVLRKPKEGHFGGGIVLACDHILVHDELNPPHVYFVPLHRGTGGYWLCGTCFKLLNNYKFDMDFGIHAKCEQCMQEALDSIGKGFPDRLHDLAAL